MMQAPGKYISNILGKKHKCFTLAYCSAYMFIIGALQAPGDLVSNAPRLVQILHTAWRGSPDPIQQQRSHKTHNTAEATVTRAN